MQSHLMSMKNITYTNVIQYKSYFRFKYLVEIVTFRFENIRVDTLRFIIRMQYAKCSKFMKHIHS